MNKEELLKEFNEKVEQLRDEFISKLKDDKKEFELTYPEENATVYYVSESVDVLETVYWKKNICDVKTFEHGLYFNTKEEGEQFLKECKLLFKLHQWAKIKNEGWEPDWSDYDDDKFSIFYKGDRNELAINIYGWSNYMSMLPTFKTKEIAQECIDLFGDEIIEVLC